MDDCEYLANCAFFKKVPEVSSFGLILKRTYCQGNFESCARFKVAKSLGMQRVPQDLDPMMQKKADMIIKNGK